MSEAKEERTKVMVRREERGDIDDYVERGASCSEDDPV
jgi:hypothetical protein